MAKTVSPARVILLGMLTGGRAATPLAMLALDHDRRSLAGAWQQWPVFRSPVGRGILFAAAAGELIGDKLPMTPSRIAPAGLVGRAAAGAFLGAAVGTIGKQDLRFSGAVFGAAGALVGSFVGWGARKLLTSATPLRDPAVALAEDVAVVSGSRAVLRAR
jgi:uncharacterized membrane protein